MKNSADLWVSYNTLLDLQNISYSADSINSNYLPISAQVDNTLLDLQNSSYPTHPHSIIAKYLPISAHATTLSSRAVINNAYCSSYPLIFSVSTYTAAKSWTSKSSLHSAVAVEEWCQAKFSSTSKITDCIFPLPILPNAVSDEGL